MKNKLTSSVLQKIKREHIVPHSRWYFVMRTTLLMGGGIFFFVLGALASAIIFHFLNYSESFEFLWHSPQMFLRILWFGLPLLWLLLLIGFGILALHLSRQTKKAYKVSLLIWTLIVFVPQIVAGFFLEQSRIGERADELFSHHVGMYESFRERRDRLWRGDEKKFLAGTITRIQDEEIFLLDDLRQREWRVDYSESEFLFPNILEEGRVVKMIGKKQEGFRFKADHIGLWKGGRWRRDEKPPFRFSPRHSGKRFEHPSHVPPGDFLERRREGLQRAP